MSTDAYKALAALVLVDRPLEETLSEITTIAQRSLPGAEATSITLVRGDKAWTAAGTGQLACASASLAPVRSRKIAAKEARTPGAIVAALPHTSTRASCCIRSHTSSTHSSMASWTKRRAVPGSSE